MLYSGGVITLILGLLILVAVIIMGIKWDFMHMVKLLSDNGVRVRKQSNSDVDTNEPSMATSALGRNMNKTGRVSTESLLERSKVSTKSLFRAGNLTNPQNGELKNDGGNKLSDSKLAVLFNKTTSTLKSVTSLINTGVMGDKSNSSSTKTEANSKEQDNFSGNYQPSSVSVQSESKQDNLSVFGGATEIISNIDSNESSSNSRSSDETNLYVEKTDFLTYEEPEHMKMDDSVAATSLLTHTDDYTAIGVEVDDFNHNNVENESSSTSEEDSKVVEQVNSSIEDVAPTDIIEDSSKTSILTQTEIIDEVNEDLVESVEDNSMEDFITASQTAILESPENDKITTESDFESEIIITDNNAEGIQVGREDKGVQFNLGNELVSYSDVSKEDNLENAGKTQIITESDLPDQYRVLVEDDDSLDFHTFKVDEVVTSFDTPVPN